MQSWVIYEQAPLTRTLRSDFKAKTDDHRQIFEKSDKKVASVVGSFPTHQRNDFFFVFLSAIQQDLQCSE